MHNISYRFTSTGLGANESLWVTEFKAYEAISTPYEYDIGLKSKSADIDMENVLSSPCQFIMEVDGEQKLVNGVLSQFNQLHQVGEYTFYRAVLVPRLWQSSLYKTNEVYLDMTIRDIIEAVLKECGMSSVDYAFKLSGNYTKWPYRCQFGETHLGFISRLMEHEGLYYYFEQGEDSEKLIICDSHDQQQPMPNPDVNYTPMTGLDTHKTCDNVYSLICCQNRISKNIKLKDYNYEKPSLDISGDADIDSRIGVGEVYLYAENFDTPEEGKQLAEVRAQEIRSTKEQFHGESGVHRISAGYFINLKKHFRNSFNQEYLIVSVRHEGTLPGHLSSSENNTPEYFNTFTAIPSANQFRKERSIPKPRFYGTINAIIDSEQSGDYAELDDTGRYKVLLPFDRADRAGGKASYWIRMAQPYGGAQEGMFFPLRKGTEVLLTFIYGDPDQPVISGVVPNPNNPSMVTADSQANSRIKTASGNLIELNDSEGKSRIKLSTPKSNSYMHLGAPNHDGDGWVLSTDGIERRFIKGGQQITVMSEVGTPTVNNQGTPDDTSDDTSKPYVTKGSGKHGVKISEDPTALFPLHTFSGGKQSTTKLTKEQEITGEYIIHRRDGDQYTWPNGADYMFGRNNNCYNLGPAYTENWVKDGYNINSQNNKWTFSGSSPTLDSRPDMVFDANDFIGRTPITGRPKKIWKKSKKKTTPDALVEFSFGDAINYQEGDAHDLVKGNTCDYQDGNQVTYLNGNSYTENHGQTHSVFFENVTDNYMSGAEETFVGGKVSEFLGVLTEHHQIGYFGTFTGFKKEITKGKVWESVYGTNTSFFKGKSFETINGQKSENILGQEVVSVDQQIENIKSKTEKIETMTKNLGAVTENIKTMVKVANNNTEMYKNHLNDVKSALYNNNISLTKGKLYTIKVPLVQMG